MTDTTAHATKDLAEFAIGTSYEDISEAARERLKLNLLDALGCAIGALDGEPVRLLRQQMDEFGGNQLCTLIGGGKSSPDRVAGYNTALTRYLDFMDNFLAEGETCHPSDNIGSVLAAAEYAECSGRDFLTALAVAYAVEIELTRSAPIMEEGFDHTTQLTFSVAAGVSRALGLSVQQAINALGICGTSIATLAVVRSSPTSQWKGLESSGVAFAATHGTFLAARGITGPPHILEGIKGFLEVTKKKLAIEWGPKALDAVLHTSLKSYNSEVHTQSAVEAMLELQGEHGFGGEDIESIEAEVFLEAYNIVGGGEYGNRKEVHTKEEADHSLPYILAVAALDGEVWPEQYAPERIERPDVQDLLQRVSVTTKLHTGKPRRVVQNLDPYTREYPEEMPSTVRVKLKDGRTVEKEKQNYPGFYATPFTWDEAVRKFERLSEKHADAELQQEIVETVARLDELQVRDLTRVLALVGSGRQAPTREMVLSEGMPTIVEKRPV